MGRTRTLAFISKKPRRAHGPLPDRCGRNGTHTRAAARRELSGWQPV